jgi:hypothetical protein
MSCLKLFAPVELTLFSPEDTPHLQIYRGDDNSPPLEDQDGPDGDGPVLLSFGTAQRLRQSVPASSCTAADDNVVYVPVVGLLPPVAPTATSQDSEPRLRLFVANE